MLTEKLGLFPLLGDSLGFCFACDWPLPSPLDCRACGEAVCEECGDSARELCESCSLAHVRTRGC